MNAGAAGEQFVKERLQRAGFTILAGNYRSRYGEIDIIASCVPYIVFIEVKTRGKHAWGLPCEAVDARKRVRLIKTAAMYLSLHPTELQPRFDVAEVYLNARGAVTDCRYLENAFDAEGFGEVF